MQVPAGVCAGIRRFERTTRVQTFGNDYAADIAAKAALRAKFIAYELPADFVQDLRDDRDALDECNSGKHSDNLEGVESTSAIDTLLSDAQAIITRLDAIRVGSEWGQASRIHAIRIVCEPTKPDPTLSKPDPTLSSFQRFSFQHSRFTQTPLFPALWSSHELSQRPSSQKKILSNTRGACGE